MSSHLTPQPGHVHLHLSSKTPLFYLEIPIDVVTTLCLRPRKYLQYLGWCVLGVSGELKDQAGTVVDPDGNLVDQAIYKYDTLGEDTFAHSVDLEVIKVRTQFSSESSTSHQGFRDKLLERDGFCVWTGFPGVGMHIIPYRRGDEWLQLIIANRPKDEGLDSSVTINDIRNGIYADNTIHDHYFDPRHVVVLKTPNPILQCNDIPTRYQRQIHGNVSYPNDCRYTLQWIVPPDDNPFVLPRYPNNNDATFKNQDLHKPADLLLHYNYGAAVVKYWGKNVSVLTERPNIPRPSVPSPAPFGPEPQTHNRNTTIGKLEAARTSQAAGRTQTGQARERSMSKHQTWDGRDESAETSVALEGQKVYDEHDVMLFFWGNSKAARERHMQKDKERKEYLENWRNGVSSDAPVSLEHLESDASVD